LSFFQFVANLKNANEAIKIPKITAYHKGSSILLKNDVIICFELGEM
jgi:hypothetical protein